MLNKLPKELTTVTRLSKTLALLMFVLLPIIAFFYGMKYQEMVDLQTRQRAEALLTTPKRTPTPTPTIPNDWKTYTNTKYGVTIKYPFGWKLSIDNYLNDIKDYIIFSIYQTTVKGPRIELYKDFQGGFCEGSHNIKDTKIEFTNEVNGRKIECSSTIAINFQKNENNLWLIVTNMDDSNRQYFDQILSTFRFSN